MTPTFTPPTHTPAAPRSAVPPPTPVIWTPPLPYRFSVAQYQHMTELGVLTADDRVELLEGFVVPKMPRNPPHDGTIQALTKRLGRRLPVGWELRVQLALVLTDSQPEPDFAVVRGDETTYLTSRPTAADAALVIEVADSSRLYDRREKARIYARAGLPVYWVVNLVDRRVEVYSDPSGPTAVPAYATAAAYALGADVPLLLPGAPPAAVPAADLLP